MAQYNTPILFLLFNRLDTTKQVFNAIRQIKPTRLYIACDGPRDGREGEKEKIEEIRKYVISNIDWKCNVKTLFREKNLSCGPAVKQAIDWFFEHEEMGIIFEDDTLPEESFFSYCEELLIRYQNDDRIGMISGNNHVGFSLINDSYVFSKFKWTWGWATWRRAWKNMDFNLLCLESNYKDSIITNMGYDKNSYNHWKRNIDAINHQYVNTWDYHWFLSLSAQNQMCIFPRVNLVSNIGFGEDATHCVNDAPERYTRTGKLDFPLCHPQYILPNYEFEKMYQQVMIPKPSGLKRFIPAKIKHLIKILLKNRNSYKRK
ncbi:MAG: hemolysin hemolytic protein [Prevotellaceae bacterium]|jgi:hypothetical protein|nr:hemolysin hemolytic protein [Prevotellaceae bacterium]